MMKKIVLFIFACTYFFVSIDAQAAKAVDASRQQTSFTDQVVSSGQQKQKPKSMLNAQTIIIGSLIAAMGTILALDENPSDWANVPQRLFDERPFQDRYPFKNGIVPGLYATSIAATVGVISTAVRSLWKMRGAAYEKSKNRYEHEIDLIQKDVIQRRKAVKQLFDNQELNQNELDELMDAIDQLESKLKKLKKKKIVRSWQDWKNSCNVRDAALDTAHVCWIVPVMGLLAVQLHKDFLNEHKDLEGDLKKFFESNFDNTQNKWKRFSKDVADRWNKGSKNREKGLKYLRANFPTKIDFACSIAFTLYREWKSIIASRKSIASKKARSCSTWDAATDYTKFGKHMNKKRMGATFIASLAAVRALHILVDALSAQDPKERENEWKAQLSTWLGSFI